MLCSWASSASIPYQEASRSLPGHHPLAGSGDAYERIRDPFGQPLSPHGPGKKKNGTEKISIPNLNSTTPDWESKGDFCLHLRPILEPVFPTKSVIAAFQAIC